MTASLNGNLSQDIQRDDDLFLACWGLQSCDLCLAAKEPCSWCSVSQVCVPNNHAPYPFAILAPIKYENICPQGWQERWEMRAKPFGCKCSSMTFISVVVAILSTLAGLVVIAILWKFGQWLMKQYQELDEDWQSKLWAKITGSETSEGEQRPLLEATEQEES